MATYLELLQLRKNSNLQDKVAVAVMSAAQQILTTVPTPSGDRVSWATSVMNNPISNGNNVLGMVLIANSGVPVSAIQNASDETIQNNVDAMVDALVLAHSVGG